MLTGGFRVSVAPSDPARTITGPMMAATLVILAALATRFTGLDRAPFVLCYFKALTGYACFTCGSTRAVGHLAHFDVLSAFAVQPLVTVVSLGLLVWGAADALLFLGGKRTNASFQGTAPRWIFLVGFGLAAANWVYLLASGV